MSKALFDQLQGDTTIKGKALHALSKYNAGSLAHAKVTLSGVVVNGQTVTVGTDVYEFYNLTVSTTAKATEALTADTTEITLDKDPNVALVAGEVLRIQDEFVVVLQVNDVRDILVLRGAFGSTAAEHTIANSVVYHNITLTAGNLPVPLNATLTAATAKTAFANAVNFWREGYVTNLGSHERALAHLPVFATVAASANAIVLFGAGYTDVVLATTGTNVAVTNFGPEVQVGQAVQSEVAHTLIAADTTAGSVEIAFPFDVVGVSVKQFADTGKPIAPGSAPLATNITVDGQLVTVAKGTNAYTTGGVLVVTAYAAP